MRRARLEADGRFDRDGRKYESAILRCNHDGTRRFLWCGPVPKNEHEAGKLIRAFLKVCEITKTPGRKKALNLLKLEKKISELPATATVQIVAECLGVSKETLERYLAEWGEPFHDMQARLHGKPKPSRLKRKLGKRKTKKKMF